ncbi:c-type cytochrome [Paenibacillus sp. y28]|uniref:c-type cytochrome n=1 Tax=Paenibacillus sp. y28 TaxID=3129110 RepID=UPI0030173163
MRKWMTCTAAALMVVSAVSITACTKKEAAPTPSPTANPGTATSPVPSPGTTTSPAASPGATAGGNGEALYKANCIGCHAANLEGGVGPSLQKVGGKYSKDQIVTLISNGKGAMPGFKGRLSDGDISTLADWLAAKK